MPFNPWFLAGGVLSAIAAALHVGIIVGGPAWYRFFHAGPRLTRLAEAGALEPVLVTLGIATVLAIWSAYAFSGAGVIPRLPLLRTGLVCISAIYLLRALALIPWAIFTPRYVDSFIVWSSAVVLVFGLTYAMGVWTGWAALSATR